MIPPPPITTRTVTLFPYTTLFRSPFMEQQAGLSSQRNHVSKSVNRVSTCITVSVAHWFNSKYIINQYVKEVRGLALCIPKVGPHEPVHRLLLTRAEPRKDDLLPPLPPGQRSNCRLRREDRADTLHPQHGSGDDHTQPSTPQATTERQTAT